MHLMEVLEIATLACKATEEMARLRSTLRRGKVEAQALEVERQTLWAALCGVVKGCSIGTVKRSGSAYYLVVLAEHLARAAS